MSDVCADNIRAVLTENGFVFKDGAFRLGKIRRCPFGVVIDLSYFRDNESLLGILEALTESKKRLAIFATDLSACDWGSPCKYNLVITGGLTKNGFVESILPGVMNMRLLCRKNASVFPIYLQKLDFAMESACLIHDGKGNITARFYDSAENERRILQLTEASLRLDDELNCLCMLESASFSLPVIPSEKMLAFAQIKGGKTVEAELIKDLYLNVGEENLVLSYYDGCEKVLADFVGGYNG